MMHNNKNRTAAALVLLVGLVLSPAMAAGKGPGYINPDTFIRIAGDDRVLVQVSVSEALLRMITRSDADLKRVAGGLKSIEAVVLDLSRQGASEDAQAALLDTERRMLRDGWERLVLVREEDSEVRILILPQDDKIQGLVVLIVDRDDDTMIFANIAGTIDLESLEELGDVFDIPGLDEIDVEDDE